MFGQFGLQTVAMLLELTLGADFIKTKRFIQAMFSVVRQDSTHRGPGASSQTGDSLVFLAADEECQEFRSLERPRIRMIVAQFSNSSKATIPQGPQGGLKRMSRILASHV